MPKKFLSPEETEQVRAGKCPRCRGNVLGPPVARGATHQYVECRGGNGNPITAGRGCGGAWRLTLNPSRPRVAAPRHLVQFDGYAFAFSSERKYLAWLRACAEYGALRQPAEHGGVQLGEIHHVLDWEADAFRDEIQETLRDARTRRRKRLDAEGGT